MSDTEDPFSRRRRTNKSTKRRKRPERLSFAVESESDSGDNLAPQQRNAAHTLNREKRKSTHQNPRKKPFGTPRQITSFGSGTNGADEDEDQKPDYSIQGLEKLRKQTATRPKAQPKVAVPSTTPEAEGVGLRNGRAQDADTVQNEPERKTAEALANVANEGFISVDRDITEQKLGTVFGADAIHACDPMVIGDEANSDEEEWEREQLKRVGVVVQDVKNEDARHAREIIEEEDMRLGGRGETGESVIETCLECISEGLTEADNRLSLLKSKTDVIEKSMKKSASVLAQHDAALAKSRTRETFYTTLSQFVGDVSEMLSHLQPKIFSFYAARKAALEQDALAVEKSLTCVTDEFDRTMDISNTVVNMYQQFDSEGSVSSGSSESSAGATDSNSIFLDVEDQFKSLKHIGRLFREWRAQFPEDYKKAYGDMSLGKIAGAIAMGQPDSEKMEWIFSLPRNSRPYAIEASHACELLNMWIIAHWKPVSVRSAREMYKIVRDVAENCAPQSRESPFSTRAVTHLFDAFLKRLSFESSFLLLACSDASTPLEILRRSVMAVVANVVRVYSKCFAPHEILKIRVHVLLDLLFGDFMKCTVFLSNRIEERNDRIELWCETVEAFGLTKSRFPSSDLPQWAIVQRELYALVESQPPESISSRVRACLDRIGA